MTPSDRAKDWANTRYYLGRWWQEVRRLIRALSGTRDHRPPRNP